jgi:hypothetical protein
LERGEIVLHTIGFIVIGVVVGAAFLWGRSAGHLILGIVLSLIGSLGAGLALYHHSRALGIVAGIVASLVLGYVGRLLAGRASTS